MTSDRSEAEPKAPSKARGIASDNEELAAFLHPALREVYRDSVLWVLDKPAGILSHPNPPSLRAPNALFRGAYDFERELYRLEPPEGRQRQVHLVHRLDQETSGILLLTFDASSAASLKEALFHRELSKEYRALVGGVPAKRRGEWADCLEKTSRGGQAVVTVRKKGRPNAVTQYAVLEVFERERLSLLSLRPETGRTHQLRVQASTRGLPIIGDARYGDAKLNEKLSRSIGLKHMFLHAYRVELRHPGTGHLLRLTAPMSNRLSLPLEALRTASPIPPVKR